jgi:thymidylate synthase (FAD)
MTDITFTSEISANLIGHAGSDLTIAQAAWVSTRNEGEEERIQGLLNYLMKHRHGSPFEQGWLQFELHIPIFVARELVRHRIGVSINEMSGRYTELEPIFWMPHPDRGLVNVGSSARPKLEGGDWREVSRTITSSCGDSWMNYQRLLNLGYAKEVARVVLPVGIYTRMHVTFNPRSMMHFLSLRVHDERATFATYPMAEIQELALHMEGYFSMHWPRTYLAFANNGRVSP